MNDDILIQRYLDHHLSPGELNDFQRRLLASADLREQLRGMAEQAVVFGDFARLEQSAPLVSTPDVNATRFTWLAIAASVAVLASSAWVMMSGQSSTVLTLIESTGNVAWSHGAPIQPGDKLPAGTLETVGDATSALFRFNDGSLITLQGDAEMSFADTSHKVLTLSRGTLSAEVKPQPAGHPMLIRTPSAVAEVVGTAFDLSARADDTLLKVNTGLVKLKRLADGSEIDVTANRSALASSRADARLDAASTPEPLTRWSFDFAQTTPPREWRGFAKNGRMNAMPYIAKKIPDGRVIIHHGISIRTAMLPGPQRLLATDNSVIRYRLRQEQKALLTVLLITNHMDGSFGGNFELHIPVSDLQPDAAGWCEVSLPLSRFRPIDRREHIRGRHPSPAGNILTSVLIHSGQTDTKLTVSQFTLEP